jgi:energy-coupling factor transporter ATP-binding protein EcfA2
MAILEIENLSYRYASGTQALRGVSLAIDAQQCLAFTGQNGAGKSTLLKSIMGLLEPGGGRISLYGEDISRSSTAQIARKVGFVFQNPRLQLFLSSVMAEVSFSPKRLGMPAVKMQTRVYEALRATGLQGREYTHPYELNPAERKLLTIACVLAMNPQILILDEPTGGMDFASVERVIQVIQTCLAEGRTVIMATHDMDLMAHCADRMVVMHQGQIIADGDKREIFTQQDLLASAHLEATAISRLASACNLPASVLTVEEMVDTISEMRRKNG